MLCPNVMAAIIFTNSLAYSARVISNKKIVFGTE